MKAREAVTMQERRINERHIEHGRVAIRILSASHGPALEGQTFFCLTGDVSVGGLSFEVHMPIPSGARLELSVEFSGPVERFRRNGCVVQCRDTQRDVILAYRVGVKLLPCSDSEHAAWQEAIERRRCGLGGEPLAQQNDCHSSDSTGRAVSAGAENDSGGAPAGA
jgi:hypothetical protein